MFRQSRVSFNALSRLSPSSFGTSTSSASTTTMMRSASSIDAMIAASGSSVLQGSSSMSLVTTQRRFKNYRGETTAIFDPTVETEVQEHNKDVPQLINESSDVKIYTYQHYLDKMEEEERIENKVKAKMAKMSADPHWMLWGTFFIGVTVFGCVAALRVRDEQVKFDPRMRSVRVLEREQGPDIGGPFTLYDLDGKKYTDESFHGKWIYIYFGFTNCPDICPDEMKKMTRVTRSLDRLIGPDAWQPIFVTIDPARDTAEVMKEYLSDFHPRILGLRGPSEDVERAAREFRVYYSVPEEHENKDQDYLIDHSIIMYLMDPKGKFSDFTTKEFSYFESYSKILARMVNFEKAREGQEGYNRNIAIITAPTGEAQDLRNAQRFEGEQRKLADGAIEKSDSLNEGPAAFGVNR